MDKVLDFNEYKENNTAHIVHEAICLSCLHRWIEVRPQKSLMKDLECPKCGKSGYVIATGQELTEDEA